MELIIPSFFQTASMKRDLPAVKYLFAIGSVSAGMCLPRPGFAGMLARSVADPYYQGLMQRCKTLPAAPGLS